MHRHNIPCSLLFPCISSSNSVTGSPLCALSGQVCDVTTAIQWLNKGAAMVCVPPEAAEALAEAGVPPARIMVQHLFTDVAAWEAIVARCGDRVRGFSVELTASSPAAGVSHLEKLHRVKQGMVSPASLSRRGPAGYGLVLGRHPRRGRGRGVPCWNPCRACPTQNRADLR